MKQHRKNNVQKRNSFYKKKYILGALLFLGILLTGGTMAFLTAHDQKVNRLAVGHNDTGIREVFPDPGPVPVEHNPNCTKKVWVTNQGSGENGFEVDCYVRVSLSYSDWDIGKAVVLQNLNTRDWYAAGDGYYYYLPVLKKGKSTTPLFTGFTIDSSQIEDSRKAYLSDFTISVYEESVQARGFQSAEQAWNYYSGPLATG